MTSRHEDRFKRGEVLRWSNGIGMPQLSKAKASRVVEFQFLVVFSDVLNKYCT